MNKGVIFFDQNLAFYKDGVRVSVLSAGAVDTLVTTGGDTLVTTGGDTLVTTGTGSGGGSGNGTEDYILSSNRETKWISTEADDTISETLTITFPEDVTISRLFLIDHNLKNYTIQYDNTGTYTDFSNVVTVNYETQASITETTYDKASSYYEFTAVTTDKIRITANTTQVADEQKYITWLVVTNEFGQFEGYPIVRGVTLDRNLQSEKMIGGKYSVQKGYETFKCRMTLNAYAVNEDIELIEQLHDTEEPFMIYLCGGRDDCFLTPQKGWGIGDVYTVQLVSDLQSDYSNGIYSSGTEKTLTFQEVV